MVSVERYVGDKTFPRECWVVHDSHVLVNILYPWGCGSCLEQLGRGKAEGKHTVRRESVSW